MKKFMFKIKNYTISNIKNNTIVEVKISEKEKFGEKDYYAVKGISKNSGKIIPQKVMSENLRVLNNAIKRL